jgi:hypothetical protein
VELKSGNLLLRRGRGLKALRTSGHPAHRKILKQQSHSLFPLATSAFLYYILTMDDILPPTDDWIFKLLFGDERNKSMLIDLLRSFVELPGEEFDLVFMDTSLKPKKTSWVFWT